MAAAVVVLPQKFLNGAARGVRILKLPEEVPYMAAAAVVERALLWVLPAQEVHPHSLARVARVLMMPIMLLLELLPVEAVEDQRVEHRVQVEMAVAELSEKFNHRNEGEKTWLFNQ